ncbi:MAG: methylmalonyl Co-A mutase-associated GTPase MeaB, partial [Actinomycetota bacterium]|nr:methylmalonyl Co-A mutase-associated GTPase MeaB [Actinomycetota bacterium]
RHEEWGPAVLLCSSVTGAGVAEVWEAVLTRRDALERSGALARQRSEQARAWMWAEVGDRLGEDLRAHPGVRRILPEVEARVAGGDLAAGAAAELVLRTFSAPAGPGQDQPTPEPGPVASNP